MPGGFHRLTECERLRIPAGSPALQAGSLPAALPGKSQVIKSFHLGYEKGPMAWARPGILK